MKLPKHYENYKNAVKRKLQFLCKSNIWAPIPYDSIEAWLANFSNDKHTYIALTILDSLIYRSNKMLESAYYRYFASELKQFVQEARPELNNLSIDEWFNQLRSYSTKLNKHLLIHPVHKPNDHGDSGNHVIRQLTSRLLSEQLVSLPANQSLKDINGKIIVLVDDLVGSGAQFKKFYTQSDLEVCLNNNVVIYAPLMATESGLSTLKAQYPSIYFHPLEVIASSEGLFIGDDNDQFGLDELNTIKDAKKCYNDIRLSHNIKHSTWMGWDNSGLSVAFEWGVPNQSLGILYYQSLTPAVSWHNLFTRRGVNGY